MCWYGIIIEANTTALGTASSPLRQNQQFNSGPHIGLIKIPEILYVCPLGPYLVCLLLYSLCKLFVIINSVHFLSQLKIF